MYGKKIIEWPSVGDKAKILTFF